MLAHCSYSLAKTANVLQCQHRTIAQPSSLHALRTSHTGVGQRTVRVCAAVLEASSPTTSSATSTPEELRALLFKRGWHRAWIDGISERAAKGELKTNVEKADKVIAFLEELGVTSQLVCNMASMSPRILGQDVEQLQSVVAFLKEQGLNDTEVHKVLEKHPKLLLFRKEGDVLALDRARAQVNKGQDGKVGVQMYREGAFLRRPKL